MPLDPGSAEAKLPQEELMQGEGKTDTEGVSATCLLKATTA